MKKLFVALLCLYAFSSCVSPTKVVPLKGKYQEVAVKSKVDKSFSQVWDSVIDLIASQGISVKLIDKASGLVLVDKSSFVGMITFEGKNGAILDPKSWIVSERMATEFQSEVSLYKASGEWNMRVKELSPGVTEVSVKVHSIEAKKLEYSLEAKSTGNFEKWILDALNIQ